MVTCSAQSRAAGEPLAGTAPFARLWVLLEQPGPWGRQAVLESHLDHEVGRLLAEWAEPHPVRLGLIRRPGRHADVTGELPRRTLLIARVDPGHQWLRYETVSDPRELLDLDPSDLLAADAEQPSQPAAPILAVCTNAKRDQCCAVLGRDLAHELDAAHPDQVWETSHLGGHRFSPTLVSLPSGYLYGGPDAGRLTTSACRGRSTLEPPAQAAELAALRHLGYEHPVPLTVSPRDASTWTVEDATSGTQLDVTISTTTVAEPRPESCLKPARSWERMTAHVAP